MRYRTMMAATAAAAALAACSSGDGAGNNSSDAGAGLSAEQVPANLQMDPQNRLVPVQLPSPVPVSALPQAFQGRWGLVPRDCDPDEAANKGLMTVSADRLAFYESRARLTQARRIGEGQIAATLDFTGEGQSWQEQTSLTLLDDGRTLLRETQHPAASLRYSRCP